MVASRMRAFSISRSREPLAPVSVRLRRNVLWIVLLLVAGLLLSAGVWVMRSSAENSVLLARAVRQLEAGELEAALHTTDSLGRRRLLPAPVRREVASLYFRLGEDIAGHNVLKGLPLRSEQAADQELLDWSSRCARTARLVEKAEQNEDPAARVRLLREARKELPDAPRLLQRLVLEELLAMSQTDDPGYEAAFGMHYAELRQKAPEMAETVKRKVGELLDRSSGVTVR